MKQQFSYFDVQLSITHDSYRKYMVSLRKMPNLAARSLQFRKHKHWTYTIVKTLGVEDCQNISIKRMKSKVLSLIV